MPREAAWSGLVGVSHIGSINVVPPNGWFVRENPILGVPPFQETPNDGVKLATLRI